MASPDPLEPSEAEVEEWVAAEHRRRETWLSGPTVDEKEAWANRERERRLAERTGVMDSTVLDPARTAQQCVRGAQLVTEGAFSLVWNWWRHRLDALVQAGREWEDEFTPGLARGGREARERPNRRRIRVEDDTPPV